MIINVCVCQDILVHGRIFVTINFLCFYANIFKWETAVTIRWKEVKISPPPPPNIAKNSMHKNFMKNIVLINTTLITLFLTDPVYIFI